MPLDNYQGDGNGTKFETKPRLILRVGDGMVIITFSKSPIYQYILNIDRVGIPFGAGYGSRTRFSTLGRWH
jgi:hypothetical protein